jgi:hypothetical protein
MLTAGASDCDGEVAAVAAYELGNPALQETGEIRTVYAALS